MQSLDKKEREVTMTTTNTAATPSAKPVNRPLALVVSILVGIVAIVWRVMPWKPWNATPVGSLSLFGGARLRWWQAIPITVSVMVVSDWLLWLWRGNEPFNPWVYGSFLINILLGAVLIRRGTMLCAGLGSVLGSVQFFLVTNFGMLFHPQSIYPRTLSGLMDSYIMGLPFFGATLVGDLVFAIAIFGSYELLAKKVFIGERVQLESATR
jgi:hypothetical protein